MADFDKMRTKTLFSKVTVARELLRSKAEEIITEYWDIAQKAKDAGDYKTAMDALQWLMSHMPKDADGSAMVDQSVDKQSIQVKGDNGPRIQIGISVGGIKKPKALVAGKAEVIDANGK